MLCVKVKDWLAKMMQELNQIMFLLTSGNGDDPDVRKYKKKSPCIESSNKLVSIYFDGCKKKIKGKSVFKLIILS